MKIEREYILNKEIEQMNVVELREHFMDFTSPKMRMYVQKGVIRQSTLDKAWKIFESENETEVRKAYKKLIVKCEEWRKKYGMKFKHIPGGR